MILIAQMYEYFFNVGRKKIKKPSKWHKTFFVKKKPAFCPFSSVDIWHFSLFALILQFNA